MVKWKGRQSGPYTLKQIEEKVASREIKGIYEILDGGEWKTVRVFLRKFGSPGSADPAPAMIAAPQPAPPVASAPPPPPPPPAAFGTDFERNLQADSWRSGATGPSRANPGVFQERVILVYGGLWVRFLAALFDHALITLLPLWLVGLMIGDSSDRGSIAGTLGAMRDLGVVGVLIVVLGSVLTWIYFAALESSAWGGTVGKKIMGLVVTTEDGERVTFQRATIRFFSKILSALMIGAGFFLAAFTRKKQAFHDILSDCTVNLSVRESRVLEGSERHTQMQYHG